MPKPVNREFSAVFSVNTLAFCLEYKTQLGQIWTWGCFDSENLLVDEASVTPSILAYARTHPMAHIAAVLSNLAGRAAEAAEAECAVQLQEALLRELDAFASPVAVDSEDAVIGPDGDGTEAGWRVDLADGEGLDMSVLYPAREDAQRAADELNGKFPQEAE